jgi:peptide/nickel transport system ATP-binding protein
LHPYTHGLLLSEPPADHRLRELVSIPGAVPAPDQVAATCPFAARCQWAAEECTRAAPVLAPVAPGRESACVRLPQIRRDMSAAREQAGREAHTVTADRAATALIQVRDARKIFHNGTRKVAALDGVSIDAGAGESVGLVGESGSGKTTLARILVGLEHADSGQITIDGITASNWASLSSKDRRKLRGTVQIVFQDPYSSLNPMRTVGSTLAEAITTHDPKAKNVPAQVTGLLESAGLPAAYAVRKPVALSGGERQRVAIARALAARPRLLICDEPVSALDVSVQAQILNLLSTLRAERGIGYLFITHDLSIVRQITDHLYVLYQGRVVESGPTEQVLTSPQDPYTIRLLQSVPSSDSGWLTAPETLDTNSGTL